MYINLTTKQVLSIRTNLKPPFALRCSTLFVRSMCATANAKEQDVQPVSAIPGLKSYPLFGQFPSLATHKYFSPKTLHLFFDDMAQQFGKISKIKLPSFPTIVLLSDPDYTEAMYNLTKDDPRREPLLSLMSVRKQAIDNFFEDKMGLLGENGEEWWRVRSKVQTPMMKPGNIVKFLPKVDEVACEFTDKIAEFQLEHGEMPDTFIYELYKWALESLGLVAFNKRLGCFDQNLDVNSDQLKLIDCVNSMLETVAKIEFGFLPLWKLYATKDYNRLKLAHDTFFDVVLRNITNVEEELKRKSEAGIDAQDLTLLEILLLTDGLTRRDVITMLLDFFFAGIDTTTHTLAFTFYCLSKNPIAQKRMQEELDNVLGDGKRILTANDIAKLSYTKHCVKESMRLFPIFFGVQRMTTKDIVIGGYNIPKGYMIMSDQVSLAKNEKYFSRANEYLPERWGRDKPLGPIHPYTILPFSHGTRMCIGRRIAEQEMYTLLCRTMHRFNVDYKHEDLDIVLKLISCPSKPLRFEFTERKK